MVWPMSTTEPSDGPGAVTIETHYFDADGNPVERREEAVEVIHRHLSADRDLVGEVFGRIAPKLPE
jgi:hypothetical protein